MPETLKRLIEVISLLPGIGDKTATKLAFFLLKSHPAYLHKFALSLENIQKDIHECARCFALTDTKNRFCSICDDVRRDHTSVCVVEDYLDMIAIDRLGIFKWCFHVLGWAISPINGVLPTDLKIRELFERIEKEEIRELIMATNPNIEGEATVMYIRENMPKKADINVTRLSKGLPNSGYIEYADEITLINAFKGRN